MAQKVFILLLTIGILGGLVFYMYTISLEFEDSVFTQLNRAGPTSPSVVSPLPSPIVPISPLPTPTSVPTPQPLPTPTPPLPPPRPSLPPPVAEGFATLSFLPSSANLKVGEELRLDIFVNTANQNAVAVLASISFDKDLLVGDHIDVAGSVYPIEAERGLYAGSARVVRGARSPGFNGSHGFLASVYFRAQAKGSGSVTLELAQPGGGPSRIILDDGEGTDILRSTVSARYTIQ